MPDKPASERTEKPTPERLKKARQEGKVPQSSEVSSALMVGVLLIVLVMAGPGLLRWSASQVRQGLSYTLPSQADAATLTALLKAKGGQVLVVLLPVMLTCLAVSVLSSMLVGGWTFTGANVKLDFERISPVAGFKNLFSLRSLVRLATSVAKLLLIAAIVYAYLRSRLATCLALRWAEPGRSLLTIAHLVVGVMGRIVAALLAVALADALFQRWKYRRDLRMTRQEVKEEIEQHELSSLTRGRIRSLQISLAQKRMLQEVPEADVVVVNPTHVAAALKYDAEVMEAPQLLAKGADLLAEKIREIARANAVPIVHRPQLARLLYETVEVGEVIPEALFVAVAEVLAMLHRIRRQRSGVTGNVKIE